MTASPPEAGVPTFGMPPASSFDPDAYIRSADDSVVDPADAPDDLSPGEELAAEFDRDVEIPTKKWNVALRPGWAAEFRVDITERELEDLRDKCRVKGKKKGPDGKLPVDGDRVSLLLLIRQCVGIHLRGKPWINDHGEPVTYRDDEFIRRAAPKVPAYREKYSPRERNLPILAADCVRAWYVLPGEVASTAGAIMEASAYLDDPEEADPTDAGS